LGCCVIIGDKNVCVADGLALEDFNASLEVGSLKGDELSMAEEGIKIGTREGPRVSCIKGPDKPVEM
ncbi:hypothetical protein CTAYLR_009438, partial [Chrysophaeum taylorii]